MRFIVRHTVEHIIEDDPVTMTAESIEQHIATSKPGKLDVGRLLVNGNAIHRLDSVADHMQAAGDELLTESSLELVHQPDETKIVYFRFNGATEYVHADWRKSIKLVKEEIAKKFEVPTNIQQLLVGHHWLNDDEILGDALSSHEGAFQLQIVIVNGFQLFVKNLNGRSLTFECNATTTVGELKRMIEEKENIPPNEERLIFKGKQIEDDRMLHAYRIFRHDIIHLVLRLRGCDCGCGQRHYVEGELTAGPPEDHQDNEAMHD